MQGPRTHYCIYKNAYASQHLIKNRREMAAYSKKESDDRAKIANTKNIEIKPTCASMAVDLELKEAQLLQTQKDELDKAHADLTPQVIVMAFQKEVEARQTKLEELLAKAVTIARRKETLLVYAQNELRDAKLEKNEVRI